MSKIERFEDLKCWQAARQLVFEIYSACEAGKLAADFDTKSQLKRAALSIMNNIAEGFGRFSKKEFIRYLDTAQCSGLEVLSISYVLEDLQYLPMDKINAIRTKANEAKAFTLGR
ncbi:MAG TPA: four helix bundle protein [Ohtaekwangia sp.]|nr:four helix bundle protein [Ohtaekwangia sp.]